MNMKKIFAIFCGLSVVLSPFTAMASVDGYEPEIKTSTVKSFFKSPFKKTQKKVNDAWSWTKGKTKNIWNDGIAGKTFITGLALSVPSFTIASLYRYAPTATTLALLGLTSISAYLAGKSFLFPKEEGSSFTKELKHNLCAPFKWIKNILRPLRQAQDEPKI